MSILARMIRVRPALVIVGASETVSYDDASERPMFTPLPWYVYAIVPPAAVAGWFAAGALAPVGGIAVKAAGAVGGAIVGLVGIVVYEVNAYGIH